jgi:hypothetical protein
MIQKDTKTRTQSILKIMNKRGVKAARMLCRALDDKQQYTESQLRAAESVCRLNMMLEVGQVFNGDYSVFKQALNGV